MLRLPPRVDFPAVIRQIEQQRGINRRTIARTLHVSPATVWRWAVGDDRPGYDHGHALVFLAGDHVADADPGAAPSGTR